MTQLQLQSWSRCSLKTKNRVPWNKVLKLARTELAAVDPKRLGGIALSADEAWKENGHWQIRVHVSKTPRSSYDFNSVLVDVETNLEDNHGLDIRLVPVYPD